MTLCIAAKAFDSYETNIGYGCVVTCMDLRVETPTASSETTSKSRIVGNFQWEILMAGTLPLAEEIVAIYDRELEFLPPEMPTIERLRKPLDVFRNRSASAFTQSRYAVSYDDFLAKGHSWFGETLFRETLAELKNYIGDQERQVQLLFIGLDEEEEIAIYKYSSGELWQCGDFAAIGSGETVAEAILHYRRIHQMLSLQEVAFAVFEAKNIGEVTPGVGFLTGMGITESGGMYGDRSLCIREIGFGGHSFLKEQLEKYSMRPYVPNLAPDPNYLDVMGFGPIREEDSRDPRSTTGELSLQQPSPESHGGTDES